MKCSCAADSQCCKPKPIPFNYGDLYHEGLKASMKNEDIGCPYVQGTLEHEAWSYGYNTGEEEKCLTIPQK